MRWEGRTAARFLQSFSLHKTLSAFKLCLLAAIIAVGQSDVVPLTLSGHSTRAYDRDPHSNEKSATDSSDTRGRPLVY